MSAMGAVCSSDFRMTFPVTLPPTSMIRSETFPAAQRSTTSLTPASQPAARRSVMSTTSRTGCDDRWTLCVDFFEGPAPLSERLRRFHRFYDSCDRVGLIAMGVADERRLCLERGHDGDGILRLGVLEQLDRRLFRPCESRFSRRQGRHAQAVVDHDKASGPAVRGQQLGQRVVGDRRPGNGKEESRDRQHADRQQQPLLELNPLAVLADRELEIRHRRPIDADKPPSIEQMDDHRHRRQRQTREQEWRKKRH